MRLRRAPARPGFEVHLDVFEGPFDLLLGLISKHKLDITEVALSQVTDEFIAYIRARADGWDLDQASYFLLVAATLLDLKAARLLPSGEVEDEEDLALLEARDLLFARLLQYRAYKEVAAVFAGRMAAAGPPVPAAGADGAALRRAAAGGAARPRPGRVRAIAARTLAPRPVPEVSTAHLHTPQTTVREQAAILASQLTRLGRATFRQLAADCAGTYEVVARFLALLELYREGSVEFDQVAPLGELYVTWVAGEPARGGPAGKETSDHERGPRPRCRTTSAGAAWAGRRGRDRRSAAAGRRARRARAAGQPGGDHARGGRAGARGGHRPGAGAAARRGGRRAARRWPRPMTAEERGFDLREVAGGWRFYTREPSARRWWSGSSGTARRSGSPRRRWRPWPWWPTGSR